MYGKKLAAANLEKQPFLLDQRPDLKFYLLTKCTIDVSTRFLVRARKTRLFLQKRWFRAANTNHLGNIQPRNQPPLGGGGGGGGGRERGLLLYSTPLAIFYLK